MQPSQYIGAARTNRCKVYIIEEVSIHACLALDGSMPDGDELAIPLMSICNSNI